MKTLILILSLVILSSCSVESRIKEHSYTDEWYYEANTRYQVYKTKSGRKYIIVLNRGQTKLIRKYLN